MNFQDLGLKEEVLKAIADLGFETPSPIQQKAIPSLISDERDLIGLAQTGTGKTAAFGLPISNLVDFDSNQIQALVICPTRELCIQISNDIKSYTTYLKNAKSVAVYGGASIENQVRDLKKGAQIVVATPGRLVDMIKRKKIKLGDVSYVVLDEADEMLNMGFKDDLDFILEKTPEYKNTWLFSATMPRDVSRIAKNYMEDPIEITVGNKNEGAKNIEHLCYMVNERNRYYALKRLLDYHPTIFGVVFCRTRRETQEVADKLIKDGYNAEALHGDMSQAQRDTVMQKFRDRIVQILVATDVAARGIDVNDITHVINYKIPEDPEVYTHRSGRTARAGKKGQSIIIMNTREKGKVKSIERMIKSSIKLAQIPNGSEICQRQLIHLADKVANTEVNTSEMSEYMPVIAEKLAEFSREELIQKFFSTEFNRFINYYKGAGNINVKAGDRNDRRDNKDRRSDRNDRRDRDRDRRDKRERNRNLDDNSIKLFFNIGDNELDGKGHLIRLICTSAGVSGKNIGQIRMRDRFSFVHVSPKISEKIISNMSGMDVEGRTLRIEISNDKR